MFLPLIFIYYITTKGRILSLILKNKFEGINMHRTAAILILSVSLLTLLMSCGKPGGLRNPEDMAVLFTKNLNEALASGEYEKLVNLFDKEGMILLNTDFNPEVHRNSRGIRNYFAAIPIDTKFEVSNIEVNGLRVEADYSYLQKNGVNGSGTWNFSINNMGKIKELAIVPGI